MPLTKCLAVAHEDDLGHIYYCLLPKGHEGTHEWCVNLMQLWTWYSEPISVVMEVRVHDE